MTVVTYPDYSFKLSLEHRPNFSSDRYLFSIQDTSPKHIYFENHAFRTLCTVHSKVLVSAPGVSSLECSILMLALLSLAMASGKLLSQMVWLEMAD